MSEEMSTGRDDSPTAEQAVELTLVIPVYNEGANFPALWQEIATQVRSPFRALVVYDFDADNTVPVVQQIIATGERRLELVKNEIGRGVVGAIRTGFHHARDGAVLVVMADLSDDLTRVDPMLAHYKAGYEVVVASRYMPGGRLVDAPVLKQAFSRIAGVSLRWLRGIPTHDATNAFKLYDVGMLRQIEIESKGGFELSLEILVKAYLRGCRIIELPTTWRGRTQGESRFRMWAWMPRYLKWYFYAFQPRKPVQNG
ncbi:MAG TPA: glycosyltransferase [Candidatus Eisenbacteria bacterium]|nr:glycosyltransferase [Candidatus Eisenbacteria bacterium]